MKGRGKKRVLFTASGLLQRNRERKRRENKKWAVTGKGGAASFEGMTTVSEMSGAFLLPTQGRNEGGLMIQKRVTQKSDLRIPS